MTDIKTPPAPSAKPVLQENSEAHIFKTVFKKGHLIEEMHFKHPGPIEIAVNKAKEFLKKRHLKHIHTVPFLIDLEAEDEENGYGIEGLKEYGAILSLSTYLLSAISSDLLYYL